MTRIREYIESLSFDYVKTYSGLRGEKLKDLITRNSNEIRELELSKSSLKINFKKRQIEKRIQALKKETDVYEMSLINKKGELHISTVEISRLERIDRNYQVIEKILKSEKEVDVASACAPIYRDGIKFYSGKNQLEGFILICFECNKVETSNNERFDLNSQDFNELRKEFMKLGHEIE